MTRNGLRIWLWGALFFLGGMLLFTCGGGLGDSGGAGGGPPPPPPPILHVQNQSQFELEQIRMHPEESYLSADNVLAAGAVLLEEEIFTINPFESPSYITIYRRRVANGPLIAITTAESIDFITGERTLIVFDDSFRLMDE